MSGLKGPLPVTNHIQMFLDFIPFFWNNLGKLYLKRGHSSSASVNPTLALQMLLSDLWTLRAAATLHTCQVAGSHPVFLEAGSMNPFHKSKDQSLVVMSHFFTVNLA